MVNEILGTISQAQDVPPFAATFTSEEVVDWMLDQGYEIADMFCCLIHRLIV